MADRQFFIPGGGVIHEEGEEEYFVPSVGMINEDQAIVEEVVVLAVAPIVLAIPRWDSKVRFY